MDPDHLLAALDGFGAVSEDIDTTDLGLPAPDQIAVDMANIGYLAVERDPSLPEPSALAHFWGGEIPAGPHLDCQKLRSLRDGFYERQKVRAGIACIHPTDRVLEVGAKLGIAGSAVALNSGAEAVLSFEANPRLIDSARAFIFVTIWLTG
ncbi:MAG: hypothetical protein ACK5II_05215 [Paracoccus sp. (in: a-proteobacteria)]